MALAQPTPLPFPESENNEPVFQPQHQDLELEFAEQFTQLQGKFVYCIDEHEFIENFQKLCFQQEWSKIYCTEEQVKRLIPSNILHTDLVTCNASVTTCEALIARTGSIMMSAAQQGRLPSVYAPVHVCVAYSSQLVYDIKDALNSLKQKYKQSLPSLVTLATGPSRTADIEKTLVVGVHGPKEVYCFIIDDKQ